jgi:predicted Zn-dependent protease
MIWWVGVALAAKPAWQPGRKATDVYNQGIDAYNQGEMKLAERHFQASRVAEPKCGLCTLMWAETVVLQNRGPEVVKYLEKLQKRFPNQVEVPVLLSDLYFVEQDFDRALEYAQVAIAQAPSNPGASLSLSQTWLRLGAYDAHEAWLAEGHLDRHAVACFRLLSAADQGLSWEASSQAESCRMVDAYEWGTLSDTAEFHLARVTGDDDQVMEILEQDGGVEPLLLGFQAFEAGDFATAKVYLERALLTDPHNTHTRSLLGLTLKELGDTEGARRELWKACEGKSWVRVDDGAIVGVLSMGNELERQRSVRYAFMTLVQLELDAGDVAAAERALSRAREREVPWGPSLDLAQVQVHLAKGELAQANTLVDAMRAAEPDGVFAEQATVALVEADPAAAARLIGELVDQGMWWAVYNQALAAERAKDPAACVALLTPLMDPSPDPQVPSLMYFCALGVGDLEMADTALAAQGGPETADPNAVLWHAGVLFERGRYGASAALLKYPDTWPDDVKRDAWDLRIMALSMSGQHDAAFKLAKHGSGEARMVVVMGGVEAGFDDQAEALLRATCPDLTGEDQEICYGMLEMFRY